MTNLPHSISQQKLRKLADRSIVVVNRNQASDVTIAFVGRSLVPAAQAFIAAYDTAYTFEAQQGAARVLGRAMLDALHARIRAWVGMLRADVPGFDEAELRGNPDEPEHLFADAKRIVEIVQARVEPLPYAQELVTDLTEQGERARAEWTAARDALVRLQELRANTRKAATEFQRRLVAFRRTLRATVGTSHLDYQGLRSSRVFETDDEPLEPEGVETQPQSQHGAPAAVSERVNGASRPPDPPA
jgi:hypothetical protein